MIYSQEKLEKLQKRWGTKRGRTLIEKIKKTRCFASVKDFQKKIKSLPYMDDPGIKGTVDLRGINLMGFDFRADLPGEDGEILDETTAINNIRFEGANLEYANFSNGQIAECNFDSANLSHATFQGSLIQDTGFEKSHLYSTDMRGAEITGCNFKNSHFRDVVLDSVLVDEKTLFGKKLFDEQEGRFHLATIQYRKLKEIFRNSNLHHIADRFHYREMVCRRKIMPPWSPLRWADFIFGDLLFKYGSSFWSILMWMGVTMLVFGFAFSSEAIRSTHTGQMGDLWHGIYFSIVTFTTLGYGDWHPLGSFQYVAAAEAILGAVLIALFTVVAARKLIRD
ncbi:MAG: pentapeptide repeat-containing protein [Patescibacteria group bacterium]|nr:pentapeptide repeat-containing protein [Patescibacteria group bacterium]